MSPHVTVQDLLSYISTVDWDPYGSQWPALAPARQALVKHIVMLANSGSALDKSVELSETKYGMEGGPAGDFPHILLGPSHARIQMSTHL